VQWDIFKYRGFHSNVLHCLIMMQSLPLISEFCSLSTDDKLHVLDILFETSPDLHKLMSPVITQQSFSSYDALINAVNGRLQALSAENSPQDREVLYGILGSHPRLGEKKASTAASTEGNQPISELSRQEQAHLNATGQRSTTQDEEQAARLADLNKEYEDTFPGLRFV
jgi:2-oxo-4-hydroxy-4-carboxy--5-ureidoimidazoline (OHCU) decarboxylase